MDMASVMAGINWLAVVVAAVATFALGGLWYGPLFGKTWMVASGMTEEKARQGNMAKIFGISFVLELIAALNLAMFLGAGSTLTGGLAAGLSVGLIWVGGAIGVLYLFEHRSLTHWFVNAGYHTVAFAMMGAILGAWH